ncbi:hypothetical protein EAH_00067950 [Eimeria acervulina]|uniref:Uncharacterized protein n=1 Tax=Eimeria acervulina TaxID=5801 RepID=U6GRW8_EIMAC|nr:hypothetical protein EAH_00067950 [Eimeria acervulina]CDI82925.1 hypothetical protein EAH_00067950 [Eimeria acervulina]
MGGICVLSTTVDFAAGALCIACGDGGKVNGLSCVLNTALDVAAAGLCIEWGWGGIKARVFSGGFEEAMRWLSVVIKKESKWYVGRWLEGFEWPIFDGVDAFAYGKTGS